MLELKSSSSNLFKGSSWSQHTSATWGKQPNLETEGPTSENASSVIFILGDDAVSTAKQVEVFETEQLHLRNWYFQFGTRGIKWITVLKFRPSPQPKKRLRLNHDRYPSLPKTYEEKKQKMSEPRCRKASGHLLRFHLHGFCGTSATTFKLTPHISFLRPRSLHVVIWMKTDLMSFLGLFVSKFHVFFADGTDRWVMVVTVRVLCKAQGIVGAWRQVRCRKVPNNSLGNPTGPTPRCQRGPNKTEQQWTAQSFY